MQRQIYISVLIYVSLTRVGGTKLQDFKIQEDLNNVDLLLIQSFEELRITSNWFFCWWQETLIRNVPQNLTVDIYHHVQLQMKSSNHS